MVPPLNARGVNAKPQQLRRDVISPPNQRASTLRFVSCTTYASFACLGQPECCNKLRFSVSAVPIKLFSGKNVGLRRCTWRSVKLLPRLRIQLQAFRRKNISRRFFFFTGGLIWLLGICAFCNTHYISARQPVVSHNKMSLSTVRPND